MMRVLGNKQMGNQNQWLRVRGTQGQPAANPKRAPVCGPTYGFQPHRVLRTDGPRSMVSWNHYKVKCLRHTYLTTLLRQTHCQGPTGSPTHCSIPGEAHPTQHWPWKRSKSTVVPTECTLPSHFPSTETKRCQSELVRI